MKSVILALIIVLAAATVCVADSPYPDNVITIKPNPFSSAHDFDCWHVLEGDIFTFELAVHNPVNPDFGSGEVRTVQNVSGFQLKFVTTSGLNVLAWRFPVPVTDVGQGEFDVLFNEPVPVVGDKVVLAEFDVWFGNAGFELPDFPTAPCYLSPNIFTDIEPATVSALPGQAVFFDADDPVDPAIPGTDFLIGYDMRFRLSLPPVNTEGREWGSLKALYR